MHLEVYQLSKKECLIKLFCEHNRGGFTRLIETMDCLGLEVVDANVTTFDINSLIILRVEVRLILTEVDFFLISKLPYLYHVKFCVCTLSNIYFCFVCT